MSVRQRGRRWIATAYDSSRGYTCHVGTFSSPEAAQEAEALAKAGLYERPRPGCPRVLPIAPAVYFIEAPYLELVKIGHSADVADRFTHIERVSPVPLRLVYLIEGDRALESRIHRALDSLRVRGEWFRRTGALADFLDLRTAA